MPCRDRNKEMGKEVAVPVTALLATAATVALMAASLFHRKKPVEAVVWTENSKIEAVADG